MNYDKIDKILNDFCENKDYYFYKAVVEEKKLIDDLIGSGKKK